MPLIAIHLRDLRVIILPLEEINLYLPIIVAYCLEIEIIFELF